MRWNIAVAIATLGFVLSAPSFAWSKSGHQTVGAIADILIESSNADSGQGNPWYDRGQQLTLQTVTVCVDCIRSIQPNQNYAYLPSKYHANYDGRHNYVQGMETIQRQKIIMDSISKAAPDYLARLKVDF